MRRTAHHEIGIPLAAFGTAQQPRPIGYGYARAVLCDLRSDIGLGSMGAALAPHDQPDMRGECLAEG